MINKKVTVRVDDVRFNMTGIEENFITQLQLRANVIIYLCVTPYWLRCKDLGDVQNYSQEHIPDDNVQKSITVIRKLTSKTNVKIASHGLFHFYEEKIKYGKRKLVPEWKHICKSAFMRDLKLSCTKISDVIGVYPMAVSPPSNIMSSDAWRHCYATGVDVIAPRSNIKNEAFLRFAIKLPILWKLYAMLGLTIYIPVYNKSALKNLKQIFTHTKELPHVVILVHPWEIEIEELIEVLNAKTKFTT